MIRIIAGSKKNMRVFSLPYSHHVKPIAVKMRKSIFDIIRPYITGSIFLDLYAGIGVVGLEALSRGAQKVVFVDNDNKCLKVIKRNIDNMGFVDKSIVLKGDILKGLIWLKYYSPEGYDIIYMGPPYRDLDNNPLFYTTPTINHIVNDNMLSENGFIIAQHHKKEPVIIPPSVFIYRTKIYGDTIVDFIKKK